MITVSTNEEMLMAQDNRTDIVAVMMREWLSPFLKNVGFRGKALTWNRQAKHLTHVINFQRGKESTKADGDFTINVAVFSPILYTHYWAKTPPTFVHDTDCGVRVRIGELMENGIFAASGKRGKRRDYWWSYDESTSPDKLADSVVAAIASCSLPFLERFESIQTIRDFLSLCGEMDIAMPNDALHLAIAMAEMGDSAGAKALLKHIHTRFDAWQGWTERIARDYKLDIQ